MSLLTSRILLKTDMLVFKPAKEGFGNRIIITVALGTHTAYQVVPLNQTLVGT